VLSGNNRRNTGSISLGNLFPSVKELLQILTTFFFVVFGWIIFRCDDLNAVFMVFSEIFSPSLFTFSNIAGAGRRKILFIIIVIMAFMIVEWIHREKQFGFQINNDKIKHRAVRWIIYAMLALMIIVFGGNQSEFIYFQF
jgi:D-alanyl-lipoteichoic acid acyltransferase DltB (MBOAT superfamily)